MTRFETRSPLTIHGVIAEWAQRTPDAPAILAPGRAPLSYSHLSQLITNAVGTLSVMGVCSSDRVAIVLPNGPEMAVAFLAVAAGAVCAPLNPAYGKNEFEFFLTDLRAKALIAQAGMDSPSIDVAEKLGVSVIRLDPVLEAEAGVFTLAGKEISPTAAGRFSGPDEVALVLHTSGTTSRPKIVPLTHRNLCASARNVSRTLALTEQDRCLNVMPLFHIHGLVGAALSSLVAGGSVVCTPGFYATRFFAWMEELGPTWYTAVPTMHQSILMRTEGNREIIARRPLRFIRSSSAALPPALMTGLESAFQAPVIESYGMTEAAHQMASNPLPPARRKPGSVGVPSGPEIAIVNEAGDLLPSGGKGEIVVRGDNVTPGYENNPSANQSGFTNGWFRTGDHGYFDSEGYLYITGRLKEVINRGGEKISPREVDEVLLDHPDILEGVAFAVPHAQLGEDVGAAVVPRENACLKETQVREFVASRLADFKVPRIVRIVDEIPKGPTGKLQRFGLAEKLNVQPIDETLGLEKAEFARPRTSLESWLLEIWRELLAIEKLGIHDNFFALGGDSVLATLLMSRVSALTEVNLPFVHFFEDPTIAAMAQQIENLRKEEADSGPRSSRLVVIQPDGSDPPLFCVGGHTGALLGFCNLARHLGPDQPLFGFPLQRFLGEKATYRLEELAAWCIEDMRALQPEGPYFLVGTCFGGVVAFEMARQLHPRGQRIALLAMVECFNHKWTQTLPLADLLGHKFRHFFRRTRFHLEHLAQLRPKDQLSYLGQRIGAAIRSMKERTGRRIYAFYFRTGKLMPRFFREARYANRQAQREYVPKRYPGSAVLFRSTAPRPGEYPAPEMGWEGLIGGEVEIYNIPGNRLGALDEGSAEVLAEHLRQSLKKARAVVAGQR